MHDAGTDDLAFAERLVHGEIRRMSPPAGAGDAASGAASPGEATDVDASQASCDESSGPIEATVLGSPSTVPWVHAGTGDLLVLRFYSTEYESDWEWYLDGNKIPNTDGDTATQVLRPGRYTVALKRDGPDGPVTEVSRQVCVNPTAMGLEVEPDGTALLDYLSTNAYPNGVGHVRWFTSQHSVTDADPQYRWSVVATDGGGDDGAQALEPGGEVTPVAVDRPGTYTVTLEVETADGLTDAWERELDVPVDPEIAVEDPPEGATGTVDVRAHYQFLPTGLEHRWYLDTHDTVKATGPTASIDVGSRHESVRLEVERPDGRVTTTHAPMVGDLPSRWRNGATIHTRMASRFVPETISNDFDPENVPERGFGYNTAEVMVLEDPQVVRFTTGEEDRPGWVTHPGHGTLQYEWSVKYSERFRSGPSDDGSNDFVTEYRRDDDRYEPRSSVLLYPFTEPGWYMVELFELAADDVPDVGPHGRAISSDSTLVYVMGLQDLGRPFPEDVQ